MSTNIELTQTEQDDFIKYMDHKIMWRDFTNKDPSSISNGIDINPTHTISSYSYWIKRNVVLLSSRNEMCFISGCNLIIDNRSTNTQKIVQLKEDCHYTSIYTQTSSTNERLIIIGEKINPIEEGALTAGRVEIINLDKTVLPEKITLNHSFYVNYDSFVYDAMIPSNSELCITILKNADMTESETKVFVWDYTTISLLAIEEFDHHIENISLMSKSKNKFLFMALYYLAIWEFSVVKKKFTMKQLFFDSEDEEICDATFVKSQGLTGLIVGFKSHKIDIYLAPSANENFEKFLHFDITQTVFGIAPKGKMSTTNLREIKELNEEYDRSNSMNDRPDEKFIMNNSDQHINVSTDLQNFRREKNTIKYVISRDKLIFIFYLDTNVYTVLEFYHKLNEDTKTKELKLKLNSTGKLTHTLLEKSSIFFDKSEDLCRMVLLIGEPTTAFYARLNKTRKTIFIHNKAAKLLSSKLANEQYKTTKDMKILHKLESVKMFYNVYSISMRNHVPMFSYQYQFLQASGMGQAIKNLSVSINPRVIIINSGYRATELIIFKQIESKKRMDSDMLSDLNNMTSMTMSFRKMTIERAENSAQESNDKTIHNKIMEGTLETYNINTSLITTKTLENTPISVTMSPYGNNFFITFREAAYHYSILDEEIKEAAKVNSYCMSAAYSKSGIYLAFGVSEFETDYSINIINAATFEIEYIISKLPPPVKLVWMDNDRKLCALFNDNSMHVVCWNLGSKHVITSTHSTSGNNTTSITKQKDPDVIMKITDFAGSILDFAYDWTIDYCLISAEDNRVRIYRANREEVYWEFQTGTIKYPSVLLLRKYDSILFGTSNGAIRVCNWPISNFTGKETIPHPSYTEKFIHMESVTHLVVSEDLKFLYSGAADGSVYISIINAVLNDNPIELSSLYTFDNRNVLPKRQNMDYSHILSLTDQMYKSKIEATDKKKFEIQTLISEFSSEKEKIMQDNIRAIEKTRMEMNEIIENKMKDVKDQENEKENQTKLLKEKRESQVRHFREEIREIKKIYKVEKEAKQNQTKILVNLIKETQTNFSSEFSRIEQEREVKNLKIKNNLQTLHTMLIEKQKKIDETINQRKTTFPNVIEKIEEKYESDLRERETNFKTEQSYHDYIKKEIMNEINKTQKDNKNYNEKISEWERHLGELKLNNEDLMETFLFNTLKLKQMNQMLEENEQKITTKEKIVKEKRLVNDRLEQLRFVLEYQIKNLNKEKTPIEEQIQNFESLHNDFYKRFNLLYAEQINIDEFIQSNKKLIDGYKDELMKTKRRLYSLKNVYVSIDIGMNSIIKGMMDSKAKILNELVLVYNKFLKEFTDDSAQAERQNINNPEVKFQTKIMEKEINKQKNKVLKDLIEKRQTRREINKEKEDLMKNIRLDNQMLIEECSDIRLNLEDILKYITDIEKKFIELTNLHSLEGNDNTRKIREEIRNAKKRIMLSEVEKSRVTKENFASEGVGHSKIASFPDPKYLLKKVEENTIETKNQNALIENMKRKVTELTGEEIKIKNGMAGKKKLPIGNTSQRVENVKNSRKITFKSKKYYDIDFGGIK